MANETRNQEVVDPLELLFEPGMNGDDFSRQITDFIPALIYVYDPDRNKLNYINRQVTDLLGYTYDDVQDWEGITNIVYKEDLPLVKEHLQRFFELKDKESHSYNARLNDKQGNWKYFRTQGKVLRRNGEGKPASILFVAQDITSEVEAGNKFKRIEELFNDTQDVLKFGVWEWDVPHNKMVWSNGIYKLLGYDQTKDTPEITPEFFNEHVIEEDRERVQRDQKEKLQHHQYDAYYRLRDRHGRVKDVREKAKVIRSDKDELLRVIGSTMDVTEQLQLYKDLADYKKTKQENEDFLGYGTWEYDIINKKFSWSNGMYKLFGYDPESARAKITVNDDLYRKHLEKEDFERSMNILELVAQKEIKGEDYALEHHISTVEGKVKKIETYAKILYDINGNPIRILGTTRDITKLRQYQLTLEEKVKDLDRSNKALEEFAYVASHDMNEPLRKITTFIERLENKYKNELGQEGNLYLSRIIASAENMRTLIDTLLEYSRTTRDPQPFIPIDLNEILQFALADLELRVDETGAIVNTDKLPSIEGIPSQLKQLFENLLNNSLKFTRPDLKPEISVHCQPLSRTQREQLHLSADHKYYKIEFIDNGIGFESEYNEKIFQIFQRLHGKSDYPGSGIGLAICKKIAEQHNGLIYATSDPGKGSVFTLILPESQQPFL